MMVYPYAKSRDGVSDGTLTKLDQIHESSGGQKEYILSLFP